ncbi:uncharacterized protein LOC141849351 [Brevipalpus obovatus]|uniref:uncharacterized protein LOC141849351 n=1 Tax=Brevipalpus obovatus TaxID=246614 RepID=UPI003D9F4058
MMNTFVLLLLLMNTIFSVNGEQILPHSQINQICSDANQVILSGYSKGEVENLLEIELTDTINELLRKQWSKEDYSDEQAVDISSKHMIGKNGFFSQVGQIGTDSASGDFFNTIFSRQTANQIQDSVVSELSFNMNPAVKQRHLDTKMDDQNLELIRQNLEKPSMRSQKSSLSSKECEDIAQSVYNRELTRLNKSRNSLKSHEKSGKSANIPQHRSITGDIVNSTSIKSEIGIGPGGVATYVTDIIRGQASNEATSQYSDAQIHGSYKNSQIDLIGIEIVSPTDLNPNNR